MSLHIIGGSFKNRSIKSPKGTQTRPTLAVLRKAVFDICQQEVADAAFLDLFAGSGAMGIEALSRGAKRVTFVDESRFAASCIQENLKLLKIESQAELIVMSATLALKRLAKLKARFDIIYIDPPYAEAAARSLLPAIIQFIDQECLLNPGGILFAEEAFPAFLKPQDLELKNLGFLNQRHFSRSILHQFRARTLS